MKKRLEAMLLALVMIVTVLSGSLPIAKKQVKAAEAPKNISIPIVFYDHIADGLLFEYNLFNKYSNELSMEGSALKKVTGATEGGQGLVESQLGENGTPVYKQEVVEKVAELVKSYMQENHTVEFSVYNQL